MGLVPFLDVALRDFATRRPRRGLQLREGAAVCLSECYDGSANHSRGGGPASSFKDTDFGGPAGKPLSGCSLSTNGPIAAFAGGWGCFLSRGLDQIAEKRRSEIPTLRKASNRLQEIKAAYLRPANGPFALHGIKPRTFP